VGQGACVGQGDRRGERGAAERAGKNPICVSYMCLLMLLSYAICHTLLLSFNTILLCHTLLLSFNAILLCHMPYAICHMPYAIPYYCLLLQRELVIIGTLYKEMSLRYRNNRHNYTQLYCIYILTTPIYSTQLHMT
jgi:hypothetical protein